jgi:hypothetical protein
MIAERCSASHLDKAWLDYIWSISHTSVDRYGPHYTWLDMEGLKRASFQAIGAAETLQATVSDVRATQ